MRLSKPARIGLGLLAALLLFLLYLGFWPAPPDVPQVKAESKTGATETAPPAPSGPGKTIAVKAGEFIQAAVDTAAPGDTILVEPGTYHEGLTIDVDYLTLKGAGDGDGRPVLDGEMNFTNGVTATGHHFTMESFIVRNYRENGVVVSGVEGVTLRDIFAENTGEYGLFPVHDTTVLVERCAATGASDAGIYVGQSKDVIVRDSEAYGNVSGFEVENSVDALVENNNAHDNTAGVLVFVLNKLDSKVGENTRVVNNRIENNNLTNFAPEGIAQNVPPGTGIMIMAADRTEVTGNTIAGNNSFGIAVISSHQVYPADTVFDVGTESEENWIHDNVLQNNGTKPHESVKEAGLPGADLLWDGSGWSNLWDEKTDSAFPKPLPHPSWPAPVRRAWWRILSFLAKTL